ncbi:olfactory receptor 52E4-like [Pelodytes ibericus]
MYLLFHKIIKIKWYGDLRIQLLGIPGLERFNVVMSVPFFVAFVCALIGNPVILFIIIYDPSLHSPMYFFLCMLTSSDLILCISIMPKLFGILWFSAQEIHPIGCLLQMFFVHFLSYMESGILVAMALDRYVAICHPLRYASILTHRVIDNIVIIIVLRGVIIITPCIFLIIRLPYCGKNLISNPYCDHMSIAKLSCGDTTINKLYGLIQMIFSVSMDISCIGLSYFYILETVLKLPSVSQRSKAFSTCTSHVCVISLFYLPGTFSLLSYRIGMNLPPSVHSILALLYLLLPPMGNPIVYGVRTKQIKQRVLNVLHFDKSSGNKYNG